MEHDATHGRFACSPTASSVCSNLTLDGGGSLGTQRRVGGRLHVADRHRPALSTPLDHNLSELVDELHFAPRLVGNKIGESSHIGSVSALTPGRTLSEIEEFDQADVEAPGELAHRRESGFTFTSLDATDGFARQLGRLRQLILRHAGPLSKSRYPTGKQPLHGVHNPGGCPGAACEHQGRLAKWHGDNWQECRRGAVCGDGGLQSPCALLESDRRSHRHCRAAPAQAAINKDQTSRGGGPMRTWLLLAITLGLWVVFGGCDSTKSKPSSQPVSAIKTSQRLPAGYESVRCKVAEPAQTNGNRAFKNWTCGVNQQRGRIVIVTDYDLDDTETPVIKELQPWIPLGIVLGDANDQRLTEFVTHEYFYSPKRFPDGTVSRMMDRPVIALKPKDNAFTYQLNQKDVAFAKIIVFGFYPEVISQWQAQHSTAVYRSMVPQP